MCEAIWHGINMCCKFYPNGREQRMATTVPMTKIWHPILDSCFGQKSRRKRGWEVGGRRRWGFQAIFPLVRIPHRQEEGGGGAIGVKGPRILCIDSEDFVHWHRGSCALTARILCIDSEDLVHWQQGSRALTGRILCIESKDLLLWQRGSCALTARVFGEGEI